MSGKQVKKQTKVSDGSSRLPVLAARMSGPLQTRPTTTIPPGSRPTTTKRRSVTKKSLDDSCDILDETAVGKRILIGGFKHGTLKYFGKTHFEEGEWCGIELDTADGKNNGEVKGVRYFECPENRGIFAPAYKVTLSVDNDPIQPPPAPKPRRSLVNNNTIQPTHPDGRNRNRQPKNETFRLQKEGTFVIDDQPDLVHGCDRPKDASKPGSEDGMDESLGILSPSDMPDFSVMSGSVTSNFAWDHALSDDEDIDCDHEETITEDPSTISTLSNSSAKSNSSLKRRNIPEKTCGTALSCSTPDTTAAFKTHRPSYSPIQKTPGASRFTLDSEKLREIEAIGPSPPTEFKLKQVDVNFSPIDGITFVKPKDEDEMIADMLRQHTEELLNSAKKRKTQQKVREKTDDPQRQFDRRVTYTVHGGPDGEAKIEDHTFTVQEGVGFLPNQVPEQLLSHKMDSEKTFCKESECLPGETFNVSEEEVEVVDEVENEPSETFTVPKNDPQATFAVEKPDETFVTNFTKPVDETFVTGFTEPVIDETFVTDITVKPSDRVKPVDETYHMEVTQSNNEAFVQDQVTFSQPETTFRVEDGPTEVTLPVVNSAKEQTETTFRVDDGPVNATLPVAISVAAPQIEEAVDVPHEITHETSNLSEVEPGQGRDIPAAEKEEEVKIVVKTAAEAELIHRHIERFLDLKQQQIPAAVTESIESGIGSMPSSIISMATSQDLYSEMDSSGVFSESETSMRGVTSSGVTSSMTKQPNISPIEETSAEMIPSPDSTPGSTPSSSRPGSGGKEAKRKRSETGGVQVEAESKRARSKSHEKGGLASRRAALLKDKPIRPNTKVGSKLKAMLEDQENRKPIQKPAKKPGKWDEVMNKMAANPGRKPNIDVVKSRVYNDFKVPASTTGGGKKNFGRSVSDNPKESKNGSVRQSFLQANQSISRSNSIVSNASSRIPHLKSLSNLSNGSLPTSQASSEEVPKILSREGSRCSNGSTPTTSVPDAAPAAPAARKSPPIRKVSSRTPVTRASKESKETSVRKFPINSQTKVVTNNNNIINAKDYRGGPSGNNRTSTSISRKPSNVANNVKKIQNAKRASPLRDTTTTTRNTANQNAQTKAYLRSTSHQPDVVQVNSPRHSEVTRLESLLDQKTRDLAKVKTQARKTAEAFDAMAAAVNYMSTELNAFETPVLRKQILQLEAKIVEKDAEIEKIKTSMEEGNSRHNEEIEKYNEERKCLLEEYTFKMNKLMEQQETIIENVRNEHKTKIENLEKAKLDEISAYMTSHENDLNGVHDEYKRMLQDGEAKWQAKLLTAVEEKSSELKTLDETWKRSQERWEEGKRALEDQIRSLNNELREKDMKGAKKGDVKLQAAHDKMAKMQAEIDSLKAVVEMKTEDIHVLRNEKVRLEEKLEEFDRTKQALLRAQAAVEDLQAQIRTKTNVERKLSEENRLLHTSMEKESFERKRLSMENEELQYRIRQQSFDCLAVPGMTMSAAEGSSFCESFTTADNTTSMFPPSLSCSYTEGCSQSLPPFPSRGPFRTPTCSRPISAPGHTSTPAPRSLDGTPSSPRVREVVEKEESVSWTLEYEGQLSQRDLTSSMDSPAMARKLGVPASPSLKRKTSAGHPATSTPKVSVKSPTPPRKPQSPAVDRVALERQWSLPLTFSSSGEKVLIQRSASQQRKKIIPTTFEPLSESTESESEKSEIEIKKSEEGIKDSAVPNPVNICCSDDEFGDISSSSEIEVGGCEHATAAFTEHAPNGSGDASPTTCDETLKHESTVNAIMNRSFTAKATAPNVMNNSLPSYDLHRLFCVPLPKHSGGESMMMEFEGLAEQIETSNSSESDPVVAGEAKEILAAEKKEEMTDSLSAVSWSEDFDD